jgi:phage tail protein X
MDFTINRNGSASYTTIDGDAVDLVAFNFYGDHDGTTELVLDANPGLADLGPIYSAGVTIQLPARAVQPRVIQQISLWD